MWDQSTVNTDISFLTKISAKIILYSHSKYMNMNIDMNENINTNMKLL